MIRKKDLYINSSASSAESSLPDTQRCLRIAEVGVTLGSLSNGGLSDGDGVAARHLFPSRQGKKKRPKN